MNLHYIRVISPSLIVPHTYQAFPVLVLASSKDRAVVAVARQAKAGIFPRNSRINYICPEVSFDGKVMCFQQDKVEPEDLLLSNGYSIDEALEAA